MATVPYFTLKTSDGTLEKHFRTIAGGWAHTLEKAQSINKTIDGNLDVSVGSIQEKYDFQVRVREAETMSGYGDEADLKYFYSLNNPNGTPTNVITFTDQLGNSMPCVMLGNYSHQLQGALAEGEHSWSIVQCTFQNISGA